MATVTNSTKWNLFSHPLRKNVPPMTTITGVDDEVAEEACRTGIFVLNYVAPDDEDDAPPQRKARSKRGAVEVEEAVEDQRETR